MVKRNIYEFLIILHLRNRYNIIQKAIEFDSYLEMMLKFENEILTFRSDRLVSANPDLFKS